MIFYKNCKILLKITIRYEKKDLFHFIIEISFLIDNFVLTFIFDFSENLIKIFKERIKQNYNQKSSG